MAQNLKMSFPTPKSRWCSSSFTNFPQHSAVKRQGIMGLAGHGTLATLTSMRSTPKLDYPSRGVILELMKKDSHPGSGWGDPARSSLLGIAQGGWMTAKLSYPSSTPWGDPAKSFLLGTAQGSWQTAKLSRSSSTPWGNAQLQR